MNSFDDSSYIQSVGDPLKDFEDGANNDDSCTISVISPYKATNLKDVKLSADNLNNEFLSLVKILESSVATTPQGWRRQGPKGVNESIQKAHSNLSGFILHPSLVAVFEFVGTLPSIGISPAVLAGIASRETELGLSRLFSPRGWGDGRHGFGIMQADRGSSALTKVDKKMLQDDYSLTDNAPPRLDPFGLYWTNVCAKILKDSIHLFRNRKTSQAVKFASGISAYNKGPSSLLFPESDVHTSNGDYANDVVVRAKYYAFNWPAIRRQWEQCNQFSSFNLSPYLSDTKIR